MKTLLLSTALIAVSALGAAAQTADATLFQTEPDAAALRASNMIGMRVYNSETAVEGDTVGGLDEGWDDLGEINDLIVSRDGLVQAVLVDVGGFLGIGERQVAINMTGLRFVSDESTADAPNDFFLVMNAPRATLEEAPAYAMDGMGDVAAGAAAGVAAAGGAVAGAAVATGEAVVDGADAVVEGGTSDQQPVTEGGTSDQQAVTEGGTSDAVTDGSTATAGTDGAMATEGTMATDGAMATEGEAMSEGAAATNSTTGADADAEAQAPATTARQPIEREGFTAAATEALTAESLEGARVYDANDEWIGDVATLLLTPEGQIGQAVIDVGGFLGLGEKPVAVPLTDMDILQQTDGTEVRVFLQRTKEELEALPTYEN